MQSLAFTHMQACRADQLWILAFGSLVSIIYDSIPSQTSQ